MKERSSAVATEEIILSNQIPSNKETAAFTDGGSPRKARKTRSVKERIEDLRADLAQQPGGLKAVFEPSNEAVLRASEGIESSEREAFKQAFSVLEADAKNSRPAGNEQARRALHNAINELGDDRMLILDPNNKIIGKWFGTLKTKGEQQAFNRDLKRLQKIANEYRKNNPLPKSEVKKSVRLVRNSKTVAPIKLVETKPESKSKKDDVSVNKFAEELLDRKYSQLRAMQSGFEIAKKELASALESRPGILERGLNALTSLFGQKRSSDVLRSIEIEQNVIKKKQALEQIREDIRVDNERYIALELLIRTSLLPAIENSQKIVSALERKLSNSTKRLIAKGLLPENDIECVRIQNELNKELKVLNEFKKNLFALDNEPVPQNVKVSMANIN